MAGVTVIVGKSYRSGFTMKDVNFDTQKLLVHRLSVMLVLGLGLGG